MTAATPTLPESADGLDRPTPPPPTKVSGPEGHAGGGGPLRIAVASDHRGQGVKGRVMQHLRDLGHTPEDFGPGTDDSVDYPDFAARVAGRISDGRADRGILICGSGLGMCIVANKYPNVRAVPCHDDLTAEVSRLHNDANVLCLSADLLGERLIGRMIDLWLSTGFEGGRHARRVAKIAALEREVADRVAARSGGAAAAG